MPERLEPTLPLRPDCLTGSKVRALSTLLAGNSDAAIDRSGGVARLRDCRRVLLWNQGTANPFFGQTEPGQAVTQGRYLTRAQKGCRTAIKCLVLVRRGACSKGSLF